LTVSIGVFGTTEGSGKNQVITFDKLLEFADKAFYDAKKIRQEQDYTLQTGSNPLKHLMFNISGSIIQVISEHIISNHSLNISSA